MSKHELCKHKCQVISICYCKAIHISFIERTLGYIDNKEYYGRNTEDAHIYGGDVQLAKTLCEHRLKELKLKELLND